MNGMANRIFICKQCQRIYLQCTVHAIVKEIQQVFIDGDGLEMD